MDISDILQLHLCIETCVAQPSFNKLTWSEVSQGRLEDLDQGAGQMERRREADIERELSMIFNIERRRWHRGGGRRQR